MSTAVEDVVALAPPLRSPGARVLDWFERVGNRFPDPVVLFLMALAATWVLSWLLAGRDFGLIDPRTQAPLRINDQLTVQALAAFLVGVTQAFVTFPPLGMVLVMVIGVAVAERSGLVGAALRGILSAASPRLLTPLVGVAALAGHVMSDGALIIIVPLGGALFYVAGRHPLAGIIAAFAPMSGALFANFFPYALDAIVAGFSETGAQIISPTYRVTSPLRAADGSLTGPGSPVMQGLIPLMLVSTLLPSLAYGMVAGTIRSHRQVVEAMATAMSAMGYYVVLVFFASLFTKAFADSNMGALIALEGAQTLRSLAMPPVVTITGIVLLTAALDFLVPSASAKWALLAPIFVPMLMGVGIAPELTQAAFRVGDGPVNLMTPLMPYFPLVLAFCRRYTVGFGVGTLMSLLLPFGLVYLLLQTAMLLIWWGIGLPLGIGGRYVYL
jgi:aminobenzoyl-glutamate transport protein